MPIVAIRFIHGCWQQGSILAIPHFTRSHPKRPQSRIFLNIKAVQTLVFQVPAPLLLFAAPLGLAC